jgi:hypothetical protein
VLIYAVLLAFAVIVVWGKFNDAETAVVQEAGASATIYRLTTLARTPKRPRHGRPWATTLGLRSIGTGL